MGTLSRRVYAIRVGDFIELRASLETPRAKTSKLTKTILLKAGHDDPLNPWLFIEKDRKRKFVLKQTFYVGGTVLGYVKLTTFSRLFDKIVPKKDELIELSTTHALNVLSPRWRRKNL